LLSKHHFDNVERNSRDFQIDLPSGPVCSILTDIDVRTTKRIAMLSSLYIVATQIKVNETGLFFLKKAKIGRNLESNHNDNNK
jgi:hypothetical protein